PGPPTAPRALHAPSIQAPTRSLAAAPIQSCPSTSIGPTASGAYGPTGEPTRTSQAPSRSRATPPSSPAASSNRLVAYNAEPAPSSHAASARMPLEIDQNGGAVAGSHASPAHF